MKKTTMVLAAGIAAALVAGSAQAAGEPDQLTGDTKTACEAIMCLAAPGSPPSECAPSLRKYFSISARKASDLRKKRRNFLKLCPTDNDDLVNSLVNGQCNAKYQDCSATAGDGGSSAPTPGHLGTNSEAR